MTDFPDIKIKSQVTFPANVMSGAGVDVTYANGSYQFNLDFGDFAPPLTTIPDVAHQYALLWNQNTGVYSLSSVPLLTQGVPEAPNDGATYGRRSLGWTAVTSGIADAPNDGTIYARQSLTWVPAPSGGGTPATATPLMNGIAAVGVSVRYAREDHVHPTDTSTVHTVANNNVIGGPNAGAALTTSSLNVLIGNNAGRPLTSGTGENVVVGAGAANSLTTGTQNTVIGAEAGTQITGDTGHTLVGYQAGLNANSGAATWNTFVGHSAGRFFTDGGSNVAVGRAAQANDVHGTYNVSVGHASMYLGSNNSGVVAFGDSAGGAPVDGSGTNWQGTGLTYWGAVSDTDCGYLGRYSGKSSAVARTNAHAVGSRARLPLRDNVMVLGHALGAVETAGRIWDGWNRTDVSSAAGLTITMANMNAGLIIRSGASVAVNDTTDTAANIVAGGPGQNCEVPASMEFDLANNGGAVLTLVGGTGVAISGFGGGGVIAANAMAHFRLIISVSTPGSESCTLYRTG